MASTNQKQSMDWNGKSGQSWLAHQERFDRMLSAHGAALLLAAAAQPGEAILDIGCGCGATSMSLAPLVGNAGSVVGVDLSRMLLDRATTRAREAGVRMDFVRADAGRHPFASQSFDLLVSRLGVMFFDDPVSAFGQLRHALRPTGRLVFLSWRSAAENEGAFLPMRAALRSMSSPVPLSPDAPGPFSFGKQDRVARLLREAGFDHIEITPFNAPLQFGQGDTAGSALDDAVEMAFHLGPLRRLLTDQTESVRTAVCHDVRDVFSSRVTAEGVMLASAAWIVTARPR